MTSAGRSLSTWTRSTSPRLGNRHVGACALTDLLSSHPTQRSLLKSTLFGPVRSVGDRVKACGFLLQRLTLFLLQSELEQFIDTLTRGTLSLCALNGSENRFVHSKRLRNPHIIAMMLQAVSLNNAT